MFLKSAKFRRRLVLCVVVGCIVFIGAAWFVGGRLVAPAHHAVSLPQTELTITPLTFASNSGVKLAAWSIPNDGATSTVILLHPLRGTRASMWGRAELFHAAGYAVFMFDFQGHGESEGDQITFGFRERMDVTAAVDFVKRNHPDHRIAVVGRSLGGAAALLASPLDIDAIVLESVYPNVADAVYNRVGMRLGPLKYIVAPVLLCQLGPRLGFTPDDLRPIDHFADVQCPVLIIGGGRDVHTPVAETERMFQAARDPKELLIVEGASHVDLLAKDRQEYVGWVMPFLELHLGE